MDWSLVIGSASLILGAGVITGSVIVAIVVARRRGLDKVEEKADEQAQRLRDDLMARVELLEKANREKDVTIASQNATIASLTAKTATLEGKVEELETSLARERRITAQMRGESGGDGR